MRIAAVQHDIAWEDGETTRKHVEPLIAQAVTGGAQLVVLTEMFATGFSMRTQKIAEDVGGPNEQFLVDQARQHGVWTLASVSQWAGDGRGSNNAILAAPDGTVHRYAKIHPFSYAGEHEHYAPGSEFVTVDVEGVRVSLFVCYDLRFADEFWVRAPDTDLYVVVANWPEPRRAHWSALLTARAIENQAYVVGVNRVGTVHGAKRDATYSGDSAIIDPMGTTLAAAHGIEAVLGAEIDPDVVRRVRAEFPFLPDRR